MLNITRREIQRRSLLWISPYFSSLALYLLFFVFLSFGGIFFMVQGSCQIVYTFQNLISVKLSGSVIKILGTVRQRLLLSVGSSPSGGPWNCTPPGTAARA